MAFQGDLFTWTNRQAVPNTIRCRLDRVCANRTALQIFHYPVVQHLPLIESDHCSVLLQSNPVSYSKVPRGGRPFHFESIWISKEECEMIIKETWASFGTTADLESWMHQGERCPNNLMELSSDPRINPRVRFGQVKKRMSKLASRRKTLEVKAEHIVLSLELRSYMPIFRICGNNGVRQIG